jgi:hypothetical protein
MTEAPGNLRFAIRFFTRGETGDFDYLLSTAPQSISIKDTLTYHAGIKENSTDDIFFKNFIKNSNNPSYVIPTRVNFLEAPENSAAIIVNPGKSDNDTLTLVAQATTADLHPITYKWYHENVGYRVY